MKAKRWYYRLLLGTGISAVLLFGACGRTASDETDIGGASELGSEDVSDTEGNVSTEESSELTGDVTDEASSELTGNVTDEDADETTDNILSEEPSEPVNEEIMGWMLEGNSILREGKEMHTVPCSVYDYDDLKAAFTSESSAYVAYFSAEEKKTAVDYTHDGGVTWETTYLNTENLFNATMCSFYFSFWDEMEGCLLCCSSPAASQMAKVLCRTTDGGKTFELVEDLTNLRNYPTGVAFCNRDRGLIITDYHGYDYYAYLTEDGGKTWTDYKVEVPDEDSYRYVEAYSIRKDASTGTWELVLRGAANGDWNMIYCTSTDDWENWQIQ